MTATKWFLTSGALGFISVISFFQINSYWADTHKFNGIFGWLGIGIVAGLAALWAMSKAFSKGTGGTQEK
jgi:hypothetical protein